MHTDLWLRYKVAATISHKVLEEVTKWLADGEKIVELCQKGDKLLDDELSKGKSFNSTAYLAPWCFTRRCGLAAPGAGYAVDFIVA